MHFWKISNKAYLGNHSFRYKTKAKDYSYIDIFKTHYYGIAFFGALNIKELVIVETEALLNKYKTLLELHHKEGGLIKTWWWNQESDNPVKKIKFQSTKIGSAAATINFAYLDIPIQAEDYFLIYHKGKVRYKGFVTNDVDISSPTVKLKGKYQRFKELLYSQDFTEYTDQKDIFKDVVESLEPDTGIHWNEEKIKLDDLESIIIKINLDFANDVIEDLLENNQNKYAGVDIDDDFYIKEDELTKIDHYLYNCDDAIYSEVDSDEDYDDVVTEYAVSRKKTDEESEESSDDSTTIFLGFVGNEGNTEYPPLSIRDKIRKIQDKIEVTSVVTDATAKQFGYSKLKSVAKSKKSIKIKKVDIDECDPEIGERCLAESSFRKMFLDINKCISILGWENALVVNSLGRNKTSCIQLFIIQSNLTYLDLGENKLWYKQEKIGFWIKNTGSIERYIEVGIATSLEDVTYTKLYCRLPDVWEWYSIPYTKEFRYIVFKNTDTSPYDIYVDDIQVLCVGKKQYIDVISKIDMTFQGSSIDCNLTLGDLSEEESDELFKLKRKIRILEAIAAI